MIAALESGRSSWTAPLDAVRLRPGDDATELTAAQIRGLVDRLATAGPATAHPAQITRGPRQRRLRLPAHWPWSAVLAHAINTIARFLLPALT